MGFVRAVCPAGDPRHTATLSCTLGLFCSRLGKVAAVQCFKVLDEAWLTKDTPASNLLDHQLHLPTLPVHE